MCNLVEGLGDGRASIKSERRTGIATFGNLLSYRNLAQERYIELGGKFLASLLTEDVVFLLRHVGRREIGHVFHQAINGDL